MLAPKGTSRSTPSETAGPGELIQIAIVYGAPNITIYRNGRKYAEYPMLDQITFDENRSC